MNISDANVKPSIQFDAERYVPITVKPAKRIDLVANGYEPLPLKGKIPIPGWQKDEINAERLSVWDEQHSGYLNTGLRTGTLAVVDNDVTDGELSKAVDSLIEKILGPSPLRRVGSKGGATFYFNESPIKKLWVSGADVSGLTHKLEILGKGQQCACFGFHPDTGKPWTWRDGDSPLNTPLFELPAVTPDKLKDLILAVKQLFAEQGLISIKSSTVEDTTNEPSALKGEPVTPNELEQVFSYVNPNAGRDRWITFAGALHNTNIADSSGEPIDYDKAELWSRYCRGELWKGGRSDWNAETPPLFTTEEDAEQAFNTTYEKEGGAGFGTLKAEAYRNGYDLIAVFLEWDESGEPDSVLPKGFHDVTSDGFASTGHLYDPWAEYHAPAFPLEVLPGDVGEFVKANAIEIGADPTAIAVSCLATLSGAISHEVSVRLSNSFFASCRLWIMQVAGPSTKKTPSQKVALAPLKEMDLKSYRDHADHVAKLKASGADANIIKAAEESEPPQLIANDLTVEKLTDILSNQNRGILIHRDELSGWIGALDRYQNGKGASADRAAWLNAYDGGPYRVQRIGRKTSPIENLSVSILGGIQPARLKELSGLQSDGLLQRFLPVMLRDADHDAKCDTPAIAAKWSTLVKSMGRHGKYTCRLSTGADMEFTRISRDIFTLAKGGAGGSGFTSFLGKLPGVWGSLALLLHLAWGNSATMEISAETARRASRLLEDFIMPHGLIFYENLVEDSRTDDQAIAACIVGLVDKGKKTVKARDLQRGPKCCQINTKDIPGKVLSLVVGMWLNPINDGPWCTEWNINPAVAKFRENAAAHRENWKALRDKIQLSAKQKDF